MVSWIWIVVAVVVVVAIAAALWGFARRRRSTELRRRFGPEYDREVNHRGRRRAEVELERRERRIHALNIRPLARESRERYGGEWRQGQTHFVDDPRGAVADADRLVAELMNEHGYPVGDFEQRAADISVDHPHVVSNYRAAHTIAELDRRGDATTEDLRKAMVHYRALFEELLGDRVTVAGRREAEQS